jgi:hypothetical protein
MLLNVALVFGMALAVREAYASEDEDPAHNLGEAERFREEDRRHRGGKGTLGQKADRRECGRKMAESVGEEEIAAELGDKAETEDSPNGAAVGHAQ